VCVHCGGILTVPASLFALAHARPTGVPLVVRGRLLRIVPLYPHQRVAWKTHDAPRRDGDPAVAATRGTALKLLCLVFLWQRCNKRLLVCRFVVLLVEMFPAKFLRVRVCVLPHCLVLTAVNATQAHVLDGRCGRACPALCLPLSHSVLRRHLLYRWLALLLRRCRLLPPVGTQLTGTNFLHSVSPNRGPISGF
jgi:hypothetical protein